MQLNTLPASALARAARTYHVLTSQSKMPSKCWGRYTHSAVVSVRAPAYTPPRIIRSTSTADVVWDSGPHFAGKSDRCAAARAYEEAVDRAEALQALADAWMIRCDGTDVC